MVLGPYLDTIVDPRLVCGCGCGYGSRREHWQPGIVGLFHAIRAAAGCAVLLTSGCRCPRHNTQVAISERSQHAIGAALDLVKPPFYSSAEWRELCDRVTVDLTDDQGGVGDYPAHGFVHVDVGTNSTPHRRWTA